MPVPERLKDRPVNEEAQIGTDMMWSYMERVCAEEIAAFDAVFPDVRDSQPRIALPPVRELARFKQKANELTHFQCWTMANTHLNGAMDAYKTHLRKALSGEPADSELWLKKAEAALALQRALHADPSAPFYGEDINKQVAQGVETTVRSALNATLAEWHAFLRSLETSGMTPEAFDAAIAEAEARIFGAEG